jgi:hypothetical protein
MVSYTVVLPDDAIEIDLPSSVKQLKKLYEMAEKLKDARVVSGDTLADYPGYTVTHYAANPFGVMCLIVRESER